METQPKNWNGVAERPTNAELTFKMTGQVSDSQIVAKFQFNVDLGGGIFMSCLNGSIYRHWADPSRLHVTYPRATATNGRQVATWIFSGRNQQLFDGWVIERFLSQIEERKNEQDSRTQKEERSFLG